MFGSLNEILPEPISPANEKVLLDLIKQKITWSADLAVRVLHAMEERFGPEAREVVRDMAENIKPPPRSNAGDPQADLRAFCANLDKEVVGSHQWERVIDEPDRIGYHYTRCMLAEIFQELGEPELGFLFCATDEPGVKAYNPKLGFRRTKVLMFGDELCDHIFHVAE